MSVQPDYDHQLPQPVWPSNREIEAYANHRLYGREEAIRRGFPPPTGVLGAQFAYLERHSRGRHERYVVINASADPAFVETSAQAFVSTVQALAGRRRR